MFGGIHPARSEVSLNKPFVLIQLALALGFIVNVAMRRWVGYI
ncbi:hypothetical protein ANRL4_00229 [Anaerolineae bacterium]|nr:hypothetical protein ANRL4_00229 [Anaerolineae bacterium]